MTVVAPEVLRERVEQYVEHAGDPSLAEVLGRFMLDPGEDSDERALVEDVLARRRGDGSGADEPDAPRDTADGEPEVEA